MKLNTSITYIEHLLSNIDKNINSLSFEQVNKQTELKNVISKYNDDLNSIDSKLSRAIIKRDQLQQELNLLREFDKFKLNTQEGFK